ncbi:MAG: hypothetical protein A2145_05315 [candidate division Zixibacteria bacterium RBG_16_40_9]|nr:MAG: hypothetical protein A2145_05315 [candidate division Zixibacteria bacterium RBG_16_40_9]
MYVTGNSLFDYATIKYAPNGDSLWVRRYHGLANRYDHAKALAVDDSGNVYVTGVIDIVCYDYPYLCYGGDYATIKYAPDGDTLWVRRYNGPGNGPDSALALSVDGSGNLYVTGSSIGSGTSADYTTIKYAPNGDTLWVRRYNGPGNGWDGANTLAVDRRGNVYVTGYSEGDYLTIKYNKFGCAAIAGDVNSDYKSDLSDIMLQINYLFKAGAKPDPFCAGDANADGNVLLPDIVYLINFLFKSGPAPIKSKECCL